MSAAGFARDAHQRVEAAFERFGRQVVRNRFTAIFVSAGLAAALAYPLPPSVETAVEQFLEEGDPARILFDRFRDQFGRAEIVIVSVKPPEVFDLGFLARLRAFHDDLENEVPYLNEVTSLINARSTRGDGDELIVEDLLEETPDSPEALEALRLRALANPFYRNTLIDEAGRLTTLLITLDLYGTSVADDESALAGFDDEPEPGGTDELALLTGSQVGAAVDGVRKVMDRYRAPDFQLSMAGSPVLQQQLMSNLQRDLARFSVITLLAICGLLYALFRRISGVLLPLVVVTLSVTSTLGAMSAYGTPISPPTQVLPTFLLAVGIGTAVHVLKIFYDRFDRGDSVEDAVAFTMGHSGVAIAMTAITTAGGLLSFLATGLQPLSALGKFAPLGILLALAYCMVLLPALLAVVPLQRKPRNAAAPARVLERWVVETGDFSARHPAWVLSATALIIGLSLHGVTQLRFSNDIMRWLPEANPLRSATRLIDQELGGSMALEVVVDTGRENGVKSPDFLAGLEEIRLRVAELRRGDTLYVGRSISIADVVKEIHQALNENRSEYYAIPQDAALVAQELLLFENTGNDDLEDLVDTRFSLTRFSIKVPYVDPIEYDGFIEAVESEFREVLGESVEIETTGFMGMMGQTMHHVIFGLARSYGLALLIITPLMMLLLSDLRIGLASMIPNLTPILLSLGLMGWLGVRIDMFTMMIGSIAIGLVVDDTIHFMHGFRRNFAQGGDARQAVRETLETTGQALLFTSLILATGFLIFAFSQMENLSYFGLFTSLTIAAAFLIDILVSPALMVLATRAQHADGDPGED